MHTNTQQINGWYNSLLTVIIYLTMFVEGSQVETLPAAVTVPYLK